MTITPTVDLTMNARITPADVLAGSTDSYRIGWAGKEITIPAAANQVVAMDVDLTQGTDKDLSLHTLLLEGGSALNNPDGVALALTKIYLLAIEFYSASDSVALVTVSAAGAVTGQDWTAYPTMRFDLPGVGSMGILIAPVTSGYAVVSGDNINIAAGAGAGTVKCKLLVVGYQA